MANPAWGNNSNILDAFNTKPIGTKARLLASLPNFEEAFFGEAAETEKPYNALSIISDDENTFKVIESLLKSLVNHDAPIPVNCAEWTSIEVLKEKLEESLTA